LGRAQETKWGLGYGRPAGFKILRAQNGALALG